MDYLDEARKALACWFEPGADRTRVNGYADPRTGQAIAMLSIAEDVRKMREIFETRCPVLGISARPSSPGVILCERKASS